MITCALSGIIVLKDNLDSNHATADYITNLDHQNVPETANSVFAVHNHTVHSIDFEYYGARAAAGHHIELNSTGHIMNSLSTRITSITSISTIFSTQPGGTLSLSTSLDGETFTTTQITSGVQVDTSTFPYFFRLSANAQPVTISSIRITYSCAEREGGIVPPESEAAIKVNTFTAKDTSTDISSTIASNIDNYFGSDSLVITAFTGEKLFAGSAPTSNFIKAGSSSAIGTLKFSFGPQKISRIDVDAEVYGSDNTSLKVSTNVDSSGETKVLGVRSTYTFNLLDDQEATSLSIIGVGKRFNFYGLTVYTAGAFIGEPLETGFSASDTKAENYLTNQSFDSHHGLVVKASMTSGPAITLQAGSSFNHYQYEVYNFQGVKINSALAFGTAGQYRVLISYKNYPSVILELTVSQYLEPIRTLTGVTAIDSNTTYQIDDIYDTVNALTVTATYSDDSTEILNYDASGTNGYSIYCLDPDGEDFYTSLPFTKVGEYLLVAEYQGMESDFVEFTVVNNNLSSDEATINILNVSEADSTNISTALQNNLAKYMSASGISLTNVAANYIFGGSGAAKLRFGSSNPGSLVLNFASEVVILGVTLTVSQYNDKVSSVKVATASNTTGQTMTINNGVTSLAYTAFSDDVIPSTNITISNAAGNQFYLHGITLRISIPNSDPVAVNGVSIREQLSLFVGQSQALEPYITPSNATNKNVVWSTSNGAIATVSSGIVRGISAGKVTISVRTEDGNFTDTCEVTITEQDFDNYYLPSVVDPNFDLQDLKAAYYGDAIPTTSTNLDILVIPVELTDYRFSNKTLSDMEILFNGTPAQTNYWESVSSFYKKSSFGKVNMNFTIAPVYDTGYTAKQAANLDTSSTQYFSMNILRSAVSNYKSINGNNSTRRFDTDGNGYIDSVILVYSCPNYSNSSEIYNISTDYWAYVFWDDYQPNSSASPNQNAYMWVSYDFMYEGGGNNKIDAHTYIHETGHLFGLDDYYNYDNSEEGSKYDPSKPMGEFDMMDYNVIDHNVWSKMALGWTKPYVVTGDAEITIGPSQTNGNCILIADNWNGMSYDEFLLLELYTPTGLNQLDATNYYGGSIYGRRAFTNPGVRLYHVDGRIGTKNTSNKVTGYYNSTSLGGAYYGFAHSNTPSSSYNPNYRQIHMIQAGGTNSYYTGSRGTNSDLFQTGHTFSMEDYGAKFFANGNRLNNGNELNYRIEFINVSAASATIRILAI